MKKIVLKITIIALFLFSPVKAFASNQTPLLKFAIINDTHSKDEQMWDNFFNLLKSQNPDIIFHVGDVGWSQNASSKITYSDYRYQPLRGLIQMQQSNPNLQIHVATGNHDVTKTTTNSYTILNGITEPACNGNHFYWGEFDGDNATHHQATEASLNPNKKTGFPIFNAYIQKNQFCTTPYDKQSYSFQASNINFVILGWDLFRTTGRVEEDKQWLKNNICNNNNSKTIIFTHHNTYQMLTNLSAEISSCQNNVALIIIGHDHFFILNKDGGIDVLMLIGGMRYRTDAYENMYSDFGIGTVYEDKIEITRSSWYEIDTSDLKTEKIFTIPGNFTQYSIPTDNNDNAVTYDYNLQIGYNFISLPSGDIKSASDLANKVGDSFKAIASYDNKQWKIYIKRDNNFVGDNFDIDENKGYILLTNKSAQITVEGSLNYASTPTQLNTGWHLLSSHTLSKLANKEDPYAQDITQANTIAFMDNNRYVIATKDNDTLIGENFQIENAKSYFIFVK